MRIAAVARIDDGDVLRALAIDTTSKEVGLAAVDKLDDADRLENVAQKAKNKGVRQRARKVVTEMDEAERALKPSVPDDVKRRRAEKAQLVREIEAVADSFDFAKVAPIVKAAEDAWGKLAADDGDDRFAKAVQRFYKRRDIHAEQSRSSDELRAIERQAQADKERAAQARVVATPTPVAEPVIVDDAQRAAREARKKEDDDRRAAELAEREVRRKEDAERGKAIAASLVAMVDDLEKLMSSDAGKDGRTIDRTLAQAAKVFEQIGKVSSGERDGIADRYTAARGKLVIKMSELREAEDWARWNNVPKAEALIQTAKALRDAENVPDLGNRLRQLQALWKEVGPMPQKRSKELWETFKTACDEVYDRVRAVRTVETEKFGEVAKLKEALIAQAESLADSEQMAETAGKLKDLQAQWKQSGHLPRKQGDELWKRFRAACDRFFERRKPMLDAQRAEEDANLAKKQALIYRAREVADHAPGEGGWGKAIGTIKDLQLDWKEIGYVPRRDADRIYREFRAACDALFAKRDAARDGEANAHRAEIDAAKAAIDGVMQGGDDVVARAIAARAKAQDLGVLAAEVEAMIRHVVATQPVQGTELDPAAARGRRAKLVARAQELLPKQAAAGESGLDVAAQLKQAMRANAFGSLRFSGRDPVEAVDELRAAWRDAGPIVDDADRDQQDAFDDVCHAVLEAAGRTDEPRRRRRDRKVSAAPEPIADDVTTRGVGDVGGAAQPTRVEAAPVITPVEADATAKGIGDAGPLPAPPEPRAKAASVPPPVDAVDTGWDLGDADPTAAPEASSPPSASEMAGDGATGGDGIADDSGWD